MGGRGPEGQVGSQHSARHRREARHHDAVDLALGQLVDVRPDEQRTLRHAQEYVGRRRHALADGGAQDLLQDPAQLDHDPLHRTQVVQYGDEEAEEEDHRQDGEGEHLRSDQVFTEDEESSVGGVAQEGGHLVAQAFKDLAAHLPADAEDAEQELARDPGDHDAPLDGAALGGEDIAAEDEEAGSHQ